MLQCAWQFAEQQKVGQFDLVGFVGCRGRHSVASVRIIPLGFRRFRYRPREFQGTLSRAAGDSLAAAFSRKLGEPDSRPSVIPQRAKPNQTLAGGCSCGFLPDFPAQPEGTANPCGSVNEKIPAKFLDLGNRLAEPHFANGAAPSDLVRYIQQRVRVLHRTIQLKIPFRFLPAPNLFFPAADVIVIVILMEQRRYQRCVQHRQILLAHRLINQ